VDVLLIDQIGKDISGTGLDTNVVGRRVHEHRAAEDERPRVKNICVRALTPRTRGNAVGLGLTEFCRTSLLREMDAEATRVNVLTSGRVSVAMLPLDFATDREMVAAALQVIGLRSPEEARLLWIANTLDLDELVCSEAYLKEARGRGELEILSETHELPFDDQGNLPLVREPIDPRQ
jgi:hypothetical protein